MHCGHVLEKYFPHLKISQNFSFPISCPRPFFPPQLWAYFPFSSPCKIVYLKNLNDWSRKGYIKWNFPPELSKKIFLPYKIFETFFHKRNSTTCLEWTHLLYRHFLVRHYKIVWTSILNTQNWFCECKNFTKDEFHM